MTFDEAIKTVDLLLTSEARAAMPRSQTSPRLAALERHAIEKVLERALERAEADGDGAA